MKIRISRENLLRQLPDELSDFVILDGLPCNPPEDSNKVKYSELFRSLTRTQWAIFSELLNTQKMTPIEIGKYCLSRKSTITNLVAVHMYELNKRLKKHDFPFEIKHRRYSQTYDLVDLR